VARCRDDGASDCPDLTLGRRSGSRHDPEELAGESHFRLRMISLVVRPSARRRATWARVAGSTRIQTRTTVWSAVEAPVASAVEPVPDGVP